MDKLEGKLHKLEFYISLLLQMVDDTKYPFFKLVIENQLSEEEVTEVIELCKQTEIDFYVQKEQGWVIYEDLLAQFVGQLNSKLPVNQVIKSLYDQEMYSELMGEFLSIIAKHN
ncbi:DUF1878 family protein [Metabacillus arenae]|uniref:DUF1878 family protein n=1 Tax=Metabacillus arenae TaxID=2771434 RepID=A0A926NG80_9BACI|nr:DUF1878 family protein [Metabacillus arenae]MBD1380711.1 DUF1878 family protein [Metabacillus arenae]